MSDWAPCAAAPAADWDACSTPPDTEWLECGGGDGGNGGPAVCITWALDGDDWSQIGTVAGEAVIDATLTLLSYGTLGHTVSGQPYYSNTRRTMIFGGGATTLRTLRIQSSEVTPVYPQLLSPSGALGTDKSSMMLRVSVNDVPAFDVQVSDASGFWTFDQNDTDYPFYLDPLVIDTQRAIDVTVNNGDVLEVELYEKDGEWENIGVGSEARPDAFYHDMTLTFIGDCGSA